MECPQCRHENREGARFCSECGQSLQAKCTNCGSPLSPGANFCDQCGEPAQGRRDTPPVDYSSPQSYTPKFLADKILTTRSKIEGERKIVTVLFADVAGYTSISEKLDPEDVHQVMDGCFKILTDEIHKYEGTVNQFTGDGVMALFGAPIAHEDNAQRACYAALAIQKALVPYQEDLRKKYDIDFKMRFGLNSGPVIVGAIGDDLRMDYTALGDTTNLASRMETNADPGVILVSKNLYKQVKEFFEFESIGEIVVKGKKEPVEAYRLIKPTEVETRIAASAAKGLTRFVGRAHEIEALKEAFDKAKAGEGQVVGIVGEAGVGKSRLLLEFRNSLPQDNEYRYFEGRCLHYGESMPYLPVLGIVRSFMRLNEGEQEYIVRQKLKQTILGLGQDLIHIIPSFQELLSLKVDDESYAKLDPKQKREKTFEAFRDLLIRGSQDRPLVLAIEDLHWIDKTTEELLGYIIGWLPRTQILLLLLYRPEYVHQWGSKSYYSRIQVGELSSSKGAELVAAILDGGDLASELRELILNRAAGNPFFIEELTHSLLENGAIKKEGDSFILAQDTSGVQLPDTIQGIIAARIDRLEESIKRIVQVAAVIGREFAFRVLETTLEVKEDLKSGLVHLQGLEFIYEKSLFPELEYIFKHAITQEVAYNSVLVQRRKEIHERIGKAIEALYPQRLEEFYEMLAWHYSHSKNQDKAWQFLKLSGQKATRSNSNREAFRLFKEALEVLQQMPRTTTNYQHRLEILRLMAVPMMPLGYPENSIDFLREGESLAKELGDDKALATFFGYIGHYYVITGGDPVLGITYAEKALSTSELIGEVEIIAPAVFDLTISYGGTGSHRKICEVAPKCIQLIERTGKQSETFGKPFNIYSLLKAQYGNALGAMGDFDVGERILRDSLECTHQVSRAFIEMYNATFYLFKGDGNKAASHAKAAAELSEKNQLVYLVGLLWTFVGQGYLILDQAKEALKHLEKGLELQLGLGMKLYLGWSHAGLGLAHLQLGNMDKALVHAEQGVKLSSANNERHTEALSEFYLGMVIGAGGSAPFEEAREHILRGIEMADELKIKPWAAVGRFYLGELNASSGRTAEAIEHLGKAEAMFSQMAMDDWLRKAQNALAKLGTRSFY